MVSLQLCMGSLQFCMVSAQFVRLSTFIRFEKVRERFHKKKFTTKAKPSPTFSNLINAERWLGIVQQKEVYVPFIALADPQEWLF